MAAARRSSDPYSPWSGSECWQLGGLGHQDLVFRDDSEERMVQAKAGTQGWMLQIDDRAVSANGEQRPDGAFAVTIDGIWRHVIVLDHGSETAVFIDGESWLLVEIDPLAGRQGDDPAGGRLTAPMPGRVTRLMIETGGTVRRGQPLMVIEAMKMEHTIIAPTDGRVAGVRFAVGDMVEEGAELITLADESKSV